MNPWACATKSTSQWVKIPTQPELPHPWISTLISTPIPQNCHDDSNFTHTFEDSPHFLHEKPWSCATQTARPQIQFSWEQK